MRRAVLLASLTAKARALSAGMGGASAQQVTLLGQDAAIALDEDLMRTPGFSVDQLMELAGLSVACAVKDAYPDASSVLVVAGPGNHGGDGLVAARHLRHFGVAKVDVVYPKQPKKQLFANLVAQCTEVDAPVSAAPPAPLATYDVVLDAVFGFSFRGAPRPPFDALLEALAATTAPLVSVDTPSGWHVERGPRTRAPSCGRPCSCRSPRRRCAPRASGGGTTSAGASCRPSSGRNTTYGCRPTPAWPRFKSSRRGGPTARGNTTMKRT